jgi:phosphoribosyl 1,2-cyclic phosphodiesterase
MLNVYCTALTQETLAGSLTFRSKPNWRIMNSGGAFNLRDLQIECFSVPHDAVDPVGFVIADEESRLGVLSDVGFVTNLIKDRLRRSDSLFIEANYDAQLLEADTKRPWATKQRISSRHGHLSNDQAAELVEEIAHANLHHVLLGHLSDDCNCPDRASRRIHESLQRAGARDARVVCAERHRPTATVEVARRLTRAAFCMSSTPVIQQELALA